MKKIVALLAGWIACFATVQSASAQQTLRLQPGDHICIIGNTLAERMQHDGWLETYLQQKLPDHQLVIRNLGFSGDELTLRLRSQDFGSQDDWLTRCQADVVFAFFGYNESFRGEEGLASFQQELAQFIQHTRSQQYNGRGAPQLVLFSPIAHQPLADPNLPDASQNNRRLEMYSRAMQQVAEQHGTLFVDLFEPSGQLYTSNQPLTINGVHLNSLGNQAVARLIVSSLLEGTWRDDQRTEEIRQAVLDKNFCWFHRYRTTDGYSTYGGRADLKFVNDQTNRQVMDRELLVLEQMTANRDRKIWAAAQGRQLQVDDSNTSPFIPVITNKPGPLEGGKHEFLSGDAAIEKMTVHPGMQVNLFASEEQFPELASPVQMAFDTRGRLWVAAWPTYPHWQPKVEEMNDKLLIFEDSDDDGRADRVKVFADRLHNPTGFEFWNGGVLLAQGPDIMFLQDTDGDDVADLRRRMLHGIDTADTHHTANSFTLGPDGAMYFQEGTFHHTQVETPWGPVVRSANAAVFRFEPRSFKFEVYIAYPFANPHGHVFNYWGQDFVTDGTGNVNYFAAPFSGHLEYPQKHRDYFPFFQQRVRPAGATEILSSSHFPSDLQGDYLIANVIGFQGLLHYKIEEDDSGYRGIEAEPILFSSDPNFRPVDIEIGPDGAIYLLDWQNPIIGHMQHNLRDPSRDKVHGRVYRVTWPERPLLQPPAIAGRPISELLELLKSREDRVRFRTRIELSGRDSEEVAAAARQWIASLDPEDPNLEHHLLEGLWLHQQHNRVNQPLLRRVLSSNSPEARAAANRVLCYWRDRVDQPLELLGASVADPHPRVRLEAVRACSFFTTAQAADVALQVLRQPMDRFLSYSLAETMRALEPYWKPEVAAGRPLAEGNTQGIQYLLATVSTAELMTMARSRPVYEALLSREGVLHEYRHEALQAIAQAEGTSTMTELIGAIQRLDASTQPSAPSVLADLAHMLTMHPAADFAGHRAQIEQLARSSSRAVTRQIAFASLIEVDHSIEASWNQAVGSLTAFRDLIAALPLVRDAQVRAAAHDRVAALLDKLPPELVRQASSLKGTTGRFVRIELPGDRRTLTLAEVEVHSNGRNIAPRGKATQKGVAHRGDAQRAIDGNKSGVFEDQGQTHTPEDRKDPWWELDLGREYPIESVRIWNRTDGDFGNRLDGFTLRILDGNRQTVLERAAMDAPEVNVSVPLEGDPLGEIVRAAINGVTFTGQDQSAVFDRLCEFVLADEHRSDAIQALSRLPRGAWNQQKLGQLVENIIDYVQSFPADQRTDPEILDELALGKALATALPRSDAERVREVIGQLGVNVIVMRPVPHRMQYDRTQIFVEAGKPVQIVFENVDVMPHNLVITSPGTLARVGIASEEMATQVDALDRAYVPAMPEVLFASKLLQPLQTERLNFVAPTQLGEYPYVCTFPGHWRTMYGTMYVVADLQSAPLEALAPAADPKIQTRPFVRDWKLAELLSDLASADQGRDFTRAKSLFTDLSCAQCHKMNGTGGDVGPELAETRSKLLKAEIRREDILREMLEPSHKIEDKYKTVIVVDLDGRVHTGVVAERTEEHLRLLANPLDNQQPVTIPVDEIDDEKPSAISIMPLGLLNTASKEEILDLLMYVESAGDEKHVAFTQPPSAENREKQPMHPH